MTFDFWLRLIVACLPLIGTISVFVIMSATAKKKAEGVTVGKIAVMRTTINPIELRSAIVKDDLGYIWEAPLPKDLRDVSEGTKCLIVIYDVEYEINRAKNGRMPVYRRELIVL